jgi:hypothetical protein
MPVIGYNQKVPKYHRHTYQASNKMQYGQGFKELVGLAAPFVQKLISNPTVQADAREFGSKAAKEIISDIKKRLQNSKPIVAKEQAKPAPQKKIKNEQIANILSRISGKGINTQEIY